MYRFARSSNQMAYRSETPLTDEQIRQHAPSVLAASAHASRGERYAFIPTIKVIDGLRKQGFQPFEVRQTRVINQDKKEHTKHMVRLRHADTITTKPEVPEIVLLNSHDGTSSYQVIAGIFRFVCSNGLIAGDVFSDIKVRHTGKVIDDVIDASFTVLEDTKAVCFRIEDYKALPLKIEEQVALADAALSLRWDADKAPITVNSLLRTNRNEDLKNDLWTTFNIIQENLIAGGVPGRGTTGRRMTTQPIGGVNENVRLNRALWTLAENMAKLKN